jgi:hypothetical protein
MVLSHWNDDIFNISHSQIFTKLIKPFSTIFCHIRVIVGLEYLFSIHISATVTMKKFTEIQNTVLK